VRAGEERKPEAVTDTDASSMLVLAAPVQVAVKVAPAPLVVTSIRWLSVPPTAVVSASVNDAGAALNREGDGGRLIEETLTSLLPRWAAAAPGPT
jgi:hypothetical protein